MNVKVFKESTNSEEATHFLNVLYHLDVVEGVCPVFSVLYMQFVNERMAVRMFTQYICIILV